MRHRTQQLCDITVAIPLRGKVSSLNASVAAGIVLWELLKE
ncbi:MAG TPA: TrmH family RNA methyltransferase [Spirochaetota bacterium]|nr:TrmH family RNA methyltransferase [Spirochaetota bacterium]